MLVIRGHFFSGIWSSPEQLADKPVKEHYWSYWLYWISDNSGT
jgi:hypothetical protein